MEGFLQQIKDFFIWLYEYILDSVTNGIVSVLTVIPVPDSLSQLTSSASAITGMAGYYLGVFNVGYGISIILGAYLIRFLIRRIPIIG